MTTPHRPPQPARTEAERPCPYCAWTLTYTGTDTNLDGTRTAEYWCANCCEYIYYDITATQHDGSG